MQLVKYEAACRALAEARSIDEVQEITNVAEALRAYAKQAGNKDLVADAQEILFRARRRCGEIEQMQKIAGLLNKGGRPSSKPGSKTDPVSAAPTLREIGLDKRTADICRKMAAVPEDEFNRHLGEWRERVMREGERVTRNLFIAGDKAMARAKKVDDLANKVRALPETQFGVILADPPWRFWVRSELGMDRSAENHYPTQSTEEICDLDVPSIAADDCILFLWATVPMLPDALAVMSAWGFEYKSHCIWAKDRMGTGYWFRNRHELLLIGTKGEVPAPAMGTQWPSVIDAAVGEHSAKPHIFIDLIEDYFPNVPKLEMNHRGDGGRPGWAYWGLEYNDDKDEAA